MSPEKKLKALGITLAQNCVDLEGDGLFIEDRGGTVADVVWGPRIGIRAGTEQPWRCYVRGSAAVSGR